MRKERQGTITDKNDPNFGRTKTSVWSRSMGFIRPVENFNIGKRQEYEDRKLFKEVHALKIGLK